MTGISPQPQTPDSLMLNGFWYRALPSDRLRRRKLTPLILLEIPMVLGRDAADKPFALRDACPHRGMPLSSGWFDGRLVECSYHGWKFDPHSGQCRLIPSVVADSKLRVDRIFAHSFQCQEYDGYVWVFIPDNAARSRDLDPPEPPRVPTFGGKYKMAHLSA